MSDLSSKVQRRPEAVAEEARQALAAVAATLRKVADVAADSGAALSTLADMCLELKLAGAFMNANVNVLQEVERERERLRDFRLSNPGPGGDS